MIQIDVAAPTVNKRPKSKGKVKRTKEGKLAPTVPRPCWLNANQRLQHHQKAKYTSLWREAGREAAEASGVPNLGDAKLFCVAFIHNPRNVSYDAQNWYPSCKAAIDGIIGDYGLLNDDDNDHLVGPLCLKGERAGDGFGGVTLIFYDMSDQRDIDGLLSRIGAL